MKTTARLWKGLLALVILSPLGPILPAKLGAGSAWGEWSGEEIRKLIGYTPSGISQMSQIWKAPMPDYAFKGQDCESLRTLSISYITAGVVGVVVVIALAVLVGRLLARRENNESS